VCYYCIYYSLIIRERVTRLVPAVFASMFIMTSGA